MIAKNKFVVMYTRVSSDNQNKEMQIASANTYLSQYNPKLIQSIHDDGVSATKNSLENRPGISELLELVKNNKVDTIIVYHRDRIARNTFEYIQVVKVLIKFGVNVIFTASNHPPFTHSVQNESIFALMSQVEGENIGKRTSDSRKQYPPRIYGYTKLQEENSKKYIPDMHKAKIVTSLFEDCISVKSKDDLYNLLLKYKKITKRPIETVFRMLFNPFYAGYYKSQTNYVPLPHVQEIISFEFFLRVQDTIEPYGNLLTETEADHFSNKVVSPICAICNKKLQYSISKDRIGSFSCTDHKKLIILAEELNHQVKNILEETLQRCQRDVIENIISTSLLKIEKHLSKEALSLNKKISKLKYSYCLNAHNEKSQVELKEIINLENEAMSVNIELDNIKQQKYRIQEVINNLNLSNHLEINTDKYFSLIKSIIKNIYIGTTDITFELYFKELWEEENCG
ncbi:recombinase family protein [Pseudalkalibacillus sp. NRS-1564]|uniref:recombinase family protein n=1 Tax=Pseudalkalibacillus sp. NRS-1564 TaxID=3233900 RepID=UPI003D26F398